MAVVLNAQKNDGKQPATLSEYDRQFIDSISNRLTLYGQLPYTIPEKMIIEMIKVAARKFYSSHYRATKHSYMFIDKNDIIQMSKEYYRIEYNQGFRGFKIKLHPSIQVVDEIYETDMKSPFSIRDIMYNLSWGASPQYYNNSLLGINANMYIIEFTCKMVEIQNMDSIYREGVPFTYSQAEKELTIFKNLERNIIIGVDRNVPLQVLYNDSLFDTYVNALCKLELRRLIGSHTINLPGDTQINIDEITKGADEDKEKVEETLKAECGTGDLIYFRD